MKGERKKEYCVYALYSLKNNCIYVGMTNNLTRRIKQHNKGCTPSTKPYIPWKLFHSESFEIRQEARANEKYLKSGCGKEYLKRILNKV